MTFNELFIRKKIQDVNEYLKETKEFFRFSLKEILGDTEKIHVAERIFQLIVDAILDINQHIIKENNLKLDDLQGTFYVLGEKNILPKDFAFKIAPIVGVRNRIVHGYESLDKKLFITNFKNNYPDFEKYIKTIKKYVKKING
jgi:uncharacterized protein YutE (UPF0331/DUF86 family)